MTATSRTKGGNAYKVKISDQLSWWCVYMQVSAEMKQLEARLTGSVKRLQLDNQMLDATQPVVLAPASVAHAHSRTAQALATGDMPLIEFTVARSFANTLIKSSLDQVLAHTKQGNIRHAERGRILMCVHDTVQDQILALLVCCYGKLGHLNTQQHWIPIR